MEQPAATTPPPSRTIERSLAILAAGAVLAFLWLAREIFIPVALAAFLALTVHPVVHWLERRKVPRSLAAAVGTIIATGVMAAIVLVLYDRLSTFWQEAPLYQDRLREAWASLSSKIMHLQRQGEDLVKAPAGGVKVQTGVTWTPLLIGTAQSAIGLAAQATVVIFTLYFALAEGPRFRQKLLSAFKGDTEGRASAMSALSEVHRDVEQYMVNRVLLNAALGLVTWAIYAIYGLEHAGVWGLTTGLLHLVPYVGPASGLVLPTGMALLQYGTLKDVLLVAGIYTALVSVQGNVVDPIFLGKQLRLSSTVVFVGSLFWFWVWGPVGLFLAVPLLSTARIACSHLPRFAVAARFLGE